MLEKSENTTRVAITRWSILNVLGLVSVRSSQPPFKMHWVCFRAFKSPWYYHRRANRADQKIVVL